jgi:hypothetical protein
MHKLIYSILIIISLALSCKSKEKISQTNSSGLDTVLLASIERTPCFGACPTYKISIYNNGYVVYEGKQHVKNIGLFSSRLDSSKVNEIKDFIEKNKILDMNDEYKNPRIADYPGTFTEASLNGKYKHILEMDPQAPKQLKDFEKFLDSFFTDETVWLPLNKELK